MNDPFANWPPIIRSSRVGRAVVLRDVLLTVLMWAMLLLILFTELGFALESLRILLGRSDAVIDAEMALFWRRMQPLMWLVGGLVLLLAIATTISILRRNRALKMPMPTPLSDAIIADLAGMDQATLDATRARRRSVIRRVEGHGLVLEHDVLSDPPSPSS